LPKDLQGKVFEWAKKEQKWLDEYQKRLVADSRLEGMKRDGVHAIWINPTLAGIIRAKMKEEARLKMAKNMAAPVFGRENCQKMEEFQIEWRKSSKNS
jgi:hypothetical protein